MPEGFIERLKRGPVLCDGAMGTQLYERGRVTFDRCLDELNLSKPELVISIHLDYVRAGAEIIETNTFGANSMRLAVHGLEGQVATINEAAVRIACEARRLTGQHIWIAGAVGPLGRHLMPPGPITPTQARQVFREHVEALVRAGVDLLSLETFGDLREIREAVLAAREVCDLPVIAQMSFTEEGRTLAGDTPGHILEALHELQVQVIGANCSVGPEPMLRVVEEMTRTSKTFLSAQPNAGFPSYQGGRFLYRSSPEYMAQYARRMAEAGVRVVGGCCGTTPDHIAAIRDALRGVRPPRGKQIPSVAEQRLRTPIPPAPAAEPSGLSRKLGRKFVVTVEVDPPKGFNVTPALAALSELKASGLVDAINVADNPRAQGRMSASAMCTLIQSRLGMETILHLALRHRNLVALHSELLGAHALGVRNVFVVAGDLPRTGDYPDATSVSDITTSGMIKLIKTFNSGMDLTGKAIEQATSFLIGCAFNLGAADMDKELRFLDHKLKAGANFILTQPVYTAEAVERAYQRLGSFPAPLLLGILPLRSHRHAEFLHNEVPGIVIP
ncbi:MAG: bifunctional homocysteine S-methyltransferase/methylenetetrahydrofolate reductase, partial [Dehalococcoidia bacterium]